MAGETLKKNYGAGDEIRTRDINLGKVALYQLSYSRAKTGAVREHGTGKRKGKTPAPT